MRRLALCVPLMVIVSTYMVVGIEYIWPDEPSPTVPLAACSGSIAPLGATNYEEAQDECEASGLAVCQGVMYLSLADTWYECDNITAAVASTLVGYIPTLSNPVTTTSTSNTASLIALFQKWKPRPSSQLGSTRDTLQQQKQCQGNYRGNTCTEKVCAFGLSSNVSPFVSTTDDTLGDNLWAPHSNANVDSFDGRARSLRDGGTHAYTECSSQGVCDRSTGTCTCFDGFHGKGCRRTQCPSDCSGHGICSRNSDSNSAYVDSDAVLASITTQYWDRDKTMRCLCDRGYTGPSCSERMCPHGDDVLTVCSTSSNFDVQVISFTDPSGAWATQQASSEVPLYYTLTFTDVFSGVYTTKPISLSMSEDRNAQEAQAALEALPNSVFPTVQVESDIASLTVTVSFTDSATSGLQNTLSANILVAEEACSEGGHAPLYYNDPDLSDVTVSVHHQDLSDDSSTYEENAPCGNRGICDTQTGICQCFEGHTGEACQLQSVFV